MYRTTMLLAGLAALALAGCQQGPTEEQMAEQNKEPLSGQQVRDLFVGNTTYQTGYSNQTSWEWAGYYAEGGNARGRAWWSGGQNEGKGTWKIDGDLWCTKWQVSEWGEGAQNCYQVYKDGKKIHFVTKKGPNENTTATWKKGNPHDL